MNATTLFQKMNNDIIITTAESKHTDGIKKLWETVFGDSDQYISLFIEQRFEPSQCVVALDKESVVAMLFLLPFVLKQADVDYAGRYIYAVATHPDYRKCGISTALLDFAHKKAKSEGAALSALVPASESLFDYYAARGFSTEFYKKEVTLYPQYAGECKLTVAKLQDMIDLRRSSFKDSKAFVDWDEKALCHQQNENALLGGETLYFTEPDKGYALCLPIDDGVFIREWSGKNFYTNVISAIASRYKTKKVLIRLAADQNDADAIPFAMTKWYISERKAQRGAPAMISLVLD